MSLSERARFLGTLEIFADLTEDELFDLAAIAEEYEYEKGSVVAYQRDTANKLIIVRSGRLFSCGRDKNGIVRESRSYFSGDYFDDIWLFTTRTYPATVQGADPGRFISIEQNKFHIFLEQNPDLIDFLVLSDEASDLAEGSLYGGAAKRFKSLKLLPDEIIEYQKRRSIAVLLIKTVIPFFLALIGLGLFWRFFGLTNTGSQLLVGLMFLLTFLYVVWQVLDWANDYFVITNKHLIHHEFSLRKFQAKIDKIPIDQVQSVEVLKPSLFATLLNIGTARITTAAQAATIIFDNVDNPLEIQDTVERIRAEKGDLDAGQTQQEIRAVFDEHFEVRPGYIRVEDPPVGEFDEGPDTAMGSALAILSNTFRTLTRGISSQVVSPDGTITYRKHPITMLGRTFWPMVIGLLLIVLIAMFDGQIRIFFAGLLFLNFLWYIWKFEDWRNETFQLTDRLVVDIDRQPFFFGVSRKQAELANVQNVSSEKPSLLANIFNFGNVKIETAGASADIVFESVARPNRVQREIFKKRENIKKNQFISEEKQRRQEYAVVADVYKQAQELDHIPRRI